MAKRQASSPAPTKAAPQDERSEYTVVARRYRPQQFAELVGQEHVAKALMNALQGDRVAHAYLFTGARGTGKTSTARILAKALNCEKGPTPTPCDQCDMCRSIALGDDIDVLEIDGASNRGIDEVRAIRQNVQTRPSRGRYKIYIIDEVHMLTGPAFNALLKTLEEPPPHVKFIFATTEVQKIPITILSRCQRFDFAGIGTQRIAERLRQVVEAEGKQADAAALNIVARRAGGSMRDAQSLLDQLLAYGEKLTVEQVHALLGTAADDRVVSLASAIIERDAPKAIQQLSAFADAGLQLGELLDQLIEYWRNLMLIGCGGPDFAGIDLPDSISATVRQHAVALPLDSILAGLDVLTTTKVRFRSTSHGLVLLEMAVVRLCRLADLVPAAQLAQWLAQSPGSNSAPTGGTRPAPGRVIEPAETAKKKLTAVPEQAGVNGAVASSASSESPLSFDDVWFKVLDEIGPMLAGELGKAGAPAISGPKSLVLRFPPRYSGAYDYCKTSSSISALEAALAQHGGQGWAVRLEIEPGPEEEASAGPLKERVPAIPPSRQRERDVVQQPLLSRAVEILGARLMRMEDGFGQNAPTEAIEQPDTQES